MGFTSSFDAAALAKAVQPQLHAVAESIGETASRRFTWRANRAPKYIVVTDHRDGTVNVANVNGLAHLDEYGTGTGSRPSGAMRSAAIEHGHYTPNPK